MNRKNFLRTLLLTCWLPFACAGLGAVMLADNAAYAHHQNLEWETTAASAEDPISLPADDPAMPDTSLPARYHLEGALFGFFSGAMIALLAATVAGSMGKLPPVGAKRMKRVVV